jgi:Bacterial pre-peptidase C-terminal domain
MKTVLLTVLFALTLFTLNPAFAQKVPNFLYITTPMLEPDVVVTGTLGEEDGQNLKDGSRLEVVQGRFKEGEAIEFNLSSDFDGYLTLYGPDKTILNSNDDVSTETEGFLSSIITEIPMTGRYVLIVSGYSEYDLGNYEVSTRRLEVSEDGPITLPADINAVLSVSDEIAEFMGSEGESLGELNYDSFTFELSEPATIQIKVGSPTLDTYLQLLDADGNEITSNDDKTAQDDPATLDTDESADFSLEAEVEIALEPGSYEIRASAYTLGFYTLSASIVE